MMPTGSTSDGDEMRRDILWGAAKIAGLAFVLGAGIVLRILSMFVDQSMFWRIFGWVGLVGIFYMLVTQARRLWATADRAARLADDRYRPDLGSPYYRR